MERFYIKRENGGRDLVQLELTYKTTIIGLKKKKPFTRQQTGGNC